MVEQLTEKQKKVLEMIAEHMRREKRPPSIPEIALHFGMKSPNGVAKHLAALETKGAIVRGHGARSIRLTSDTSDVETPPDVSYAPILGQIAAGEPILAAQFGENLIPLPKAMVSGTESAFLLEVKGESMIEEGILPGDYVIVAPGPAWKPGDMVAVRIDDEATVKRIFRDGNRIILQPSNSAFQPIILVDDGKTVEVMGKVIGLMRSYGLRKLG
jgi:repressor LexA